MPGGKHGVNRHKCGPAAVNAKLRCVSERICTRRKNCHDIASLDSHSREAGIYATGDSVQLPVRQTDTWILLTKRRRNIERNRIRPAPGGIIKKCLKQPHRVYSPTIRLRGHSLLSALIDIPAGPHPLNPLGIIHPHGWPLSASFLELWIIRVHCVSRFKDTRVDINVLVGLVCG